MEKWAEAVKSYVSKAAKAGQTVDGYRVTTRAATGRIRDVQTAYIASGLAPVDFMACCSVSLGALRDAFVAANLDRLDPDTGKKATKKALAGEVFEEVLGGCIERGEPIQMLIKAKAPLRGQIVGDCEEDACI
jgi:hypothetical protein